MSDNERVKRILEDYDRDTELYKRLGEEVERLLKDLLRTSEIAISSVTHRLKERDGFERKIQSAKYTSAQSVTDIAGARVITYHADDVDRVANIIRDERNFEIDVRNTVDKRRGLRTDQFGYQSLHLVASLGRRRIFDENRDLAALKIEIQVRSLLQHTWAEIEHAYYKAERSLPPPIRRRVSLLAGLLEIADNEFVAVRKDATELTKELPICRVNGITELIPDFPLDLPYSALPAESDLSNKALILVVNTNITNRLLEGSSKETEVEMYVEQGGPSAYMRKGVLVGQTALAFSDVFPMAFPSKGESIRIRISGLRVNACQLGLTSGPAPNVVVAVVCVGEKDHVDVSTPLTSPSSIAQVLHTGHFRVEDIERPTQALPVKLSNSELPKNVCLRVTYRAFTSDVFRPAGKERSPSEMSRVRGTRLLLRLNGVPAGGRVFVTIRDLPDSGGHRNFQLTTADGVGNGTFNPVEVSSKREINGREVGFAEATIIGTATSATWECTDLASTDEVISFGVIIALPAQASISSMFANGCLAPLSTNSTASSDGPVPRFCDRSAPITILESV